MDRLLILAIACVTQLGCHTAYSPFGAPATRVPPPPTGSIGSGNYDTPGYSQQSPYPPANYSGGGYPQSAYPPSSYPPSNYPGSSFPGSTYAPGNPAYSPTAPNGRRFAPARSQSPIAPLPPSIGSYIPPQRVPGETITGVGPWRYWESSAQNAQVAASGRSMNAPSDRAGSVRPNSLTRNDQLRWTEPVESELVVAPTVERHGHSSAPVSVTDRSTYPTVVRGNNLPSSQTNETDDSPRAPRYIPVPTASKEIQSAGATDGWHSTVGERR